MTVTEEVKGNRKKLTIIGHFGVVIRFVLVFVCLFLLECLSTFNTVDLVVNYLARKLPSATDYPGNIIGGAVEDLTVTCLAVPHCSLWR